MPFKDIKLKIAYNSDKDDISALFFNPVLKESTIYMRVSAYFSSQFLKTVSEGMSSLAWNGGKALIIASVQVPEEDASAFRNSKSMLQKKIDEIFPSKNELKQLMEDRNVEAFGKLVESGSIDMKFAVAARGIFHMKYGIAIDQSGDRIAFAGSINETLGGHSTNVEQFDIFRSWLQGEMEHEENYYNEFKSYWDGTSTGGAIIVDMPPESEGRIKEAYEEFKKENNSKLPYILRKYQNKAVNFFEEHGFISILEMATGTGKTFTALECAKILFLKNGRHFTIIAVPTLEIGKQWEKEWQSFFKEDVLFFDAKNMEKNKVPAYVLFSMGQGVLIATYRSLSTTFFIDLMSNSIKCKKLLIADEAHWLGANKTSAITGIKFESRLGLSATPERMFDDNGTEEIISFFHGNEYKYELPDAIHDGFLSRYLYNPYYAELLDGEIEQYTQLTNKAAKKYAMAASNDEERANNQNSLNLLYIKRAKIHKKARNKFAVLEKILTRLHGDGKLEKLIIFFDDADQLNGVIGILNKLGIGYGRISSTTESASRQKIINSFSKNNIKCILAIRIMDEGIDIPSAQREIIMASSSNPRQYIQRAGRILRNKQGKGLAEIYDIITYGDPSKYSGIIKQAEKAAIKREVRRAMYFAENAENRSESISSLYEFAQKFNISIW